MKTRLAKSKTVVGSKLSCSDQVRYEIAGIRHLVKSWSLSVPEPRRADIGAIFVTTAFYDFSKIVAPNLELTEPFASPHGDLAASVKSLPSTLAQLVSQLDLAEAVYILTSIYTSMLPTHTRGTLGAFYTPPALADRLIELAEESGTNWQTAKILDPACGGGAFLVPVAQKMRASLEGSEPAFVLRQVGNRLAGLELDPYAGWFAQAALDICFADLSLASGCRFPNIVKIANTLETAPDRKFDLVIGNPPYGRVKLTDVQRERYSRSLYGHANLYGVFTDIALRWIKGDGTVAYLTPTSVLGGQYFSALRRLLGEKAPPVAIDFVQSRKGVFEDALQEIMLAIYQNGKETVPAQVHYLQVSDERRAKLVRNGTIALPNDTSHPWLAPRSPEQSKLAVSASRMATRLEDWGYKVSTGPLVWNRFKSQLSDKSGKDCLPLIWAEAVTADGKFVFRAEKRNHTPYFKVGPKDGWLVVRKPSVLVQRTTAKEQPRRLIAAELPAEFLDKHQAVIIENHLNMVVPVGVPKVSLAALTACLNSAVVDQVFRCISGSVAVSAYELSALPLPTARKMKSVERLIESGCDQGEIETAIERLYLRKGS